MVKTYARTLENEAECEYFPLENRFSLDESAYPRISVPPKSASLAQLSRFPFLQRLRLREAISVFTTRTPVRPSTPSGCVSPLENSPFFDGPVAGSNYLTPIVPRQQGMNLRRAQSYLQHVVEHTEAIAFRRYCGGVGRTSQVKTEARRLARWLRIL